MTETTKPAKRARKPVKINEGFAYALGEEAYEWAENSQTFREYGSMTGNDIADGLGRWLGCDMVNNNWGGTTIMPGMGRVFVAAIAREYERARAAHIAWAAKRAEQAAARVAYETSPEGIAEAEAKAKAHEAHEAKRAADNAAREAARVAYAATPEGIAEAERVAALLAIVQEAEAARAAFRSSPEAVTLETRRAVLLGEIAGREAEIAAINAVLLDEDDLRAEERGDESFLDGFDAEERAHDE